MRIVSIAKYLYFLLGILLLSSCLKEEEYAISKEQERRQSLVDELRLYFDASYDEERLRSLSSTEDIQPLLFKGLQPMWEYAKLDKYSADLESVEVPLRADELHLAIPQVLSMEDMDKYQRKVFSLSLLREYNPHTKFKQEFFVCYLPNKEQLEKGLPRNYRLATLPKDYEGEIILFSLDLKPLYRYRIGNGQIEKKYIATKAKNSLRGWVREEICTWTIIDTSWYVYQEGRPEDAVYNPRFKLDVICRSRYEWQPEHIPDVDNGISHNIGGEDGYYPWYLGSVALEQIYLVPLASGLDLLLRNQDVEGFSNYQKAKLNDIYKQMLKHDIQRRLDSLLKVHPKKKLLGGIVLKGSDPDSLYHVRSMSIGQDYKLNIYGIEQLTERGLFHELVHLYQVVTHGIESIVDLRYRGAMEAENWLIRDIIKLVHGTSDLDYGREPWALRYDNLVYDSVAQKMNIDIEYHKYLQELTGMGTHYPNKALDTDKYRQFIDNFLLYNPMYGGGVYKLDSATIYNPSVVESLFNVK